jgi:hypothetical protein
MPTQTQPIRRKPGRPASLVEGEQLSVRLPIPALAQLDGWRRMQADLPTRPEAVRRLMELAFTADASPRGTEAIRG